MMHGSTNINGPEIGYSIAFHRKCRGNTPS